MKRFRSLLLISLLSILPDAICAQQLQASHSHYSTDDGLCSNAISDIRQDDLGFLWIATWNGLSRYDGYNFFNYTTGNNSHIPFLHNRIIDLQIDNAQNVWMRMYDGRIFMLNRKTDCIENPLRSISEYQNLKTQEPITITSNNVIYIIMDGVGIYELSSDKWGIHPRLISTGSLHPTCICEGYRGDLWVGTQQGVHRLNTTDGTLERNGILTNESVKCLYSNGFFIFAGTESGKICRFSYGAQPLVVHQSSSAISSLFIDSHKLLWYTDNRQGVSYINTETGAQHDFTQTVVIPQYDIKGAICREANGTVWINMNHGGFGYYNRLTDQVEYFHNDPSNTWNLSNTVSAFLPLPEGVIWECTSRKGLEKLEILKNTIQRTRLYPIADGSDANEIRAMYCDMSTRQVLMGNKQGGLFAFSGSQKRPITLPGLGRIYHINKDRQGYYWICSKGNGLFRVSLQGASRIVTHYDEGKDSRSLNNKNVYCTVEDHQGNIWAATYGGGINILVRQPDGTYKVFNKDNSLRLYPKEAYEKIRTLTVDRQGNVWAGTTDGLLIMSFSHNRFHITQVANSDVDGASLGSNDIVCLATDTRGSIWVGTNGGGLSHTVGKDEQGNWKFETFGNQDGLPSEEIKSITFDRRGNVWFATDHILCSFDIRKRIFSTFTIQDGVDDTICSEAAALLSPSGNILFGTLDGFYTVDLHKLVNQSGSMLKLHITDFYLNDELITPRTSTAYAEYIPDAKRVELPEHSSVFAFRFASLNYQLQHRVHYQYCMEGYDDKWHNVDKTRTVSFSGLPAGTYTFRVKAFLLESPEKYDLRTIEVVVPPYFLLSANALWIYLILTAIIVLSTMYFRQQRLARFAKLRVLRLSPEEMAFKHDEDYNFVKEQLTWLEEHYGDSDLKIDDLVSQSGMSRTSYYNQLKSLTDKSPKEFISDFRLKKAIMYLAKSEDTVSEIAYKTGFNDPVYFTRLFKSRFGITPTKYREKEKEKISKETTEKEAKKETPQDS